MPLLMLRCEANASWRCPSAVGLRCRTAQPASTESRSRPDADSNTTARPGMAMSIMSVR